MNNYNCTNNINEKDNNNNLIVKYKWFLIVIIIIIIVLLLFLIACSKNAIYYAMFNPKHRMVWYPNQIKYKKQYKKKYINQNISTLEDYVVSENQNYIFNDLYIDLNGNYSKEFSYEKIINIWWLKNLTCDIHKNTDYTKTYGSDKGLKIKRKVVYFLHGNNGNISDRDYVVNMCKLLNCDLLLLDYRGYGRSKGIVSHENFLEDSVAGYKFLRKNYSSNQIIVWGESLGGPAATWIASKYSCYRLILMSTFSDLNNLTDSYIADAVIKLSFVSLDVFKWIEKVKCPIAIVHSKYDTLIPYRNSKKNYNSIKHNNKIYITIKGDHSTPHVTIENMFKLYHFINIPLNKYQYKSLQELISKLTNIINNMKNKDWKTDYYTLTT